MGDYESLGLMWLRDFLWSCLGKIPGGDESDDSLERIWYRWREETDWRDFRACSQQMKSVDMI